MLEASPGLEAAEAAGTLEVPGPTAWTAELALEIPEPSAASPVPAGIRTLPRRSWLCPAPEAQSWPLPPGQHCAYAKQFLGNPYVYGGTSLTEGADCSGFTMKVFEHFGISTGRSSRDQAAKGKEIPIDSVQPGDLLFYASGDYINMCLYIAADRSSTPARLKTGS